MYNLEYDLNDISIKFYRHFIVEKYPVTSQKMINKKLCYYVVKFYNCFVSVDANDNARWANAHELPAETGWPTTHEPRDHSLEQRYSTRQALTMADHQCAYHCETVAIILYYTIFMKIWYLLLNLIVNLKYTGNFQ